MNKTVEVVPGYHSAVNEIIEPDKVLVVTRYFVRRWMPILGENGTRIVLALRSLGYYNRQTGEKREGIEIDLPELAAMCGLSVATLKREFGERHDGRRQAIPGSAQNSALHKFVQKDRQYWRDPVTNRLLRTANIYRVMMDDPLHEDDLPRLQEILESREKGGSAPSVSKAQSEPKMPKGRRLPLPSKAHIDSNLNESDSQKSHIDSEMNESDSQKSQSEPTLIEYFSVPSLPKETSRDAAAAAPDIFASLVPEKEKTKEPERTVPLPVPFASLSEADQARWLDQAEGELRENFGLSAWLKTAEKARAGLRRQRAQNLYHQSLSVVGQGSGK